MEKSIQDIFELSTHPMLAIENYRFTMANAAARKLFQRDIIGLSAAGLLPAHIMNHDAEEFTCSAEVEGQDFTASVRHSADRIYVSLAPLIQPGQSGELLSDFLLNSIMSSLFTTEMGIAQINKDLSKCENEKLMRHMAVTCHNFFMLRRSLVNLNTAVSLKKGSIHLSPTLLDLNELCSRLLETVTPFAESLGINLEFSPAPGTVLTRLDYIRTEHIILNILSNSFAHTPRGGRLSLGIENRGSSAVISIDDNGCGIDPEMMGSIFSCYELALTRKNLSSGCTGGLGLGIARGLAQLQDGALIIESRVGVGTCVRILLPIRVDGALRFQSESLIPENCGMAAILTQLSTVLDNDFYTGKYLF